MKIAAALCGAILLAGATPLAAQMCNDEIAGLTVDEKGNYVIEKPVASGHERAPANMSRPPKAQADGTTPLEGAAPDRLAASASPQTAE
jgi:hypothetical protein